MSETSDILIVTGSGLSTGPISQAWAAFSQKLAHILSKLEQDQYLIISEKTRNHYVQFARQGEVGMRVEVTSNHFLKGKDRLNRRQISWLRANAWNAPTGSLNEATPKKDPNGSPNYFVDLPTSVAIAHIAERAVKALVNGLGVASPTSLIYEAFNADGREIRIEDLGLERSIIERRVLMEKVLAVFRQVSGIADLELDKDGDVSIFYGEVRVYAIPVENKVRLASALLMDVNETPSLLRRLNELNVESYGSRCVVHHQTVFALLDILAVPFIPEYLAAALRELSETAEKLAFLLRGQFSGKRPASTSATSSYIQ